MPCCGRRWGKSQAAGHRMTVKSFIPESYNWIIGPTYKLGEKEFRVVWHDYEKLGILKYCRKSYSPKQGDMRIKTPWGSVVEVVSADKQDSLLGEGLSHAIMAEAARHSMSTWEQYIEPALSDLRGSCDFPSTPKGYNWYHGLYELGQSLDHPEFISWTFPSWMNSIRYPGGIDDPEVVRIREVASQSYFDQEYGARFTAIVGAIYEEWKRDIHVQKHVYNPEWPNYLAFDYGFANPFVCLDVQISPSDDVFVWREYYHSGKSTMDHGYTLKSRENPDGYRVDGMWGDPRGADEAATLAMILGYVASEDVAWGHGIEYIKRLLKNVPPKFFVSPNCINLARQMEQLHVRETADHSKIDISELTGDRNIQHKKDDHAADAIRYLIGPLFVAGRREHLEDVYGTNYLGSESNEFFTLHSGVTLDSGITLNA